MIIRNDSTSAERRTARYNGITRGLVTHNGQNTNRQQPAPRGETNRKTPGKLFSSKISFPGKLSLENDRVLAIASVKLMKFNKGYFPCDLTVALSRGTRTFQFPRVHRLEFFNHAIN